MQVAGKLVCSLIDLGRKLLQATGHAHRPALVAEVSLDLAHDGGRGIGGELQAALRLEAVNGLDEADGAHLDKVVQRLAAVLELGSQKTHQVEVAHDKLLASILVPFFFVSAEKLPGALLVPGKLAPACTGRDAPGIGAVGAGDLRLALGHAETPLVLTTVRVDASSSMENSSVTAPKMSWA